MATKLVSPEEAKSFCIVEHDDDEKLIELLLAQAHARLQGYIDRGLDAYERAETYDGGAAALFLRHWPVTSVSSVVDNKGTVSADDNETLDASEYRLDGVTGMLWRTTQHGAKRLWEPGQQRFAVTYTGGLEASANWEDYERDELAATVRDLVSYWYDHRDPALLEDKEGAGTGRKWESFMKSAGLPPAVRAVWDSYVVRG